MRRWGLLGVAALLAAGGFVEVLRSAVAGAPAPVNDGYGDYVFVPAGSFKMGDNFSEGDARERPVHVVDLDAFYIAKFEMTNGEWKKFRDDPGYDDPKFWPGGRPVPKNQVPYWNDVRNHGGGTPNSDGYPLLGVNWDSATAYCNWLSAKTGKKYRLPTEAEWEKAARGTDQRRYPWGNNDRPHLCQLRRRATLTRERARLLRRQQARRPPDAQQRFALRRIRHGGQRHGVVPGLVQQAITTRCLPARIRRDRRRAPTASFAAARSSWRPSTCGRQREPRPGPRSRAIAWSGSAPCASRSGIPAKLVSRQGRQARQENLAVDRIRESKMTADTSYLPRCGTTVVVTATTTYMHRLPENRCHVRPAVGARTAPCASRSGS